MKKVLLPVILIFVCAAPMAHADSACWPEAKLLGTKAIGFIGPYSTAPFDIFLDATLSNSRRIDCEKMFPSCEGSDYNVVPVWEILKGDLLKITLADHSFGYARMQDVDYHTVPWQKAGTLEPLEIVVFSAPDINSKPVLSSDHLTASFLKNIPGNSSHGFTYDLLSLVSNSDGTWMKVNERAYKIIDEDPNLIKKSGITRSGYILQRDKKGFIRAALNEEWCD